VIYQVTGVVKLKPRAKAIEKVIEYECYEGDYEGDKQYPVIVIPVTSTTTTYLFRIDLSPKSSIYFSL